MKKTQTILLVLFLTTASLAQSQALRVVGYEGEVVFTNGDRYPVSGATQMECDDAYNAIIAEHPTEDLYEGKLGTQPCIPVFIYRSPTAPSADSNPAATLWPELPFPPVCLSCPFFDNPHLIKKLYPNNAEQVQEIVQHYKIDQYNLELQALQNQYQEQLAGFEKKMFALDQYLANKEN